MKGGKKDIQERKRVKKNKTKQDESKLKRKKNTHQNRSGTKKIRTQNVGACQVRKKLEMSRMDGRVLFAVCGWIRVFQVEAA